jgi:hypothetical protein
MQTNANDQYKILCSKNNVILKRALTSDTNSFVIDFEICNARISLERFCNFNIFTLMFELNREDAIQDLRITDAVTTSDPLQSAEQSDPSEQDPPSTIVKDMFLLFKRKGDDIGIKQKYMNLCLTMSKLVTPASANYVFQGKPVHFSPSQMISETDARTLKISAEEICDVDAVFCLSLIDPHHMRVQFMMTVPPAARQQPSYIENGLGIIMKKILLRLKTFIEQMDIKS